MLVPQLFSIFINDMSQNPKIKIVLFVDDTLIYVTDQTNNVVAKRLQEHLKSQKPWFNDWNITINATKTKMIMFTNKSNQDTPEI